MRTTNTNKYPQGYANKIVYWTEQFAESMTKEDREIAQSKIDYFTKRQAELDGKIETQNAPTKLDDKAIELLIQENKDDYQIRIEKYLKDRDGKYNFQFNWIGGGFNDVWAFTKEEAIKIVAKEQKESKKLYPTKIELKADPNTFIKATRSMSDEQNRMGWMMSI